MEESDGRCPVERRHGDGYSRLLSPHQRAVGGVQGLPGPAGRGGSLAGPAAPEEQVKKRCACLLVLEDPCSSSCLGQEVGVCRPRCIQGRQCKLFFGATKLFFKWRREGPREGPAEAVPTRTAARPQRDAGHGLRGAEGRRGPAGAGAPAARWASRPPRRPNDRPAVLRAEAEAGH